MKIDFLAREPNLGTLLLGAFAVFLLSANRVEAKPLNIWFGPTRPAIQKDGKHTGSADYDSLFDADAPWQKAANETSVFKTYASFISNEKPKVLKNAFQFLSEHHMKLAIEFGPMNKIPDRPYVEAEGWAQGGAENARNVCERIKKFGGNLDFLAMDEPFWNGNVKPPAGSKAVGPYEMAHNAKLTVDAVRAVFPDAEFGDTEPVQPTPGVDLVAKYALWLEAWRSVMGSPMAFFHMDVGWDHIPNEEIAAIGRMCQSKNVPFGIIYNGYTHDQNNHDWLHHAHAWWARYEVPGNPAPDQPVLQSWNFYPDRVLPETDPDAHTNLILEYVRHRHKSSAQF